MSTSVQSDLDHAPTTSWLLRFALPTIISTVFMTAFSMINGIFAARMIDTASFAAVGVVMPFFGFTSAMGFMLAIGGSALVAKQLGQGRHHDARSTFTLLGTVVVAIATVLTAVALISPDLILTILGVDDHLRPLSAEFLTTFIPFGPLAMAGVYTQQFFITEGKPQFGLYASLGGGLLGFALNFLLIGPADLGLTGAALATAAGFVVPALAGVIFFARNRDGVLTFVRPDWRPRRVARASLNGASEMVAMLAMSVTQIVTNNIVISLAGYQGAAAAAVALTAVHLLGALFLGFSMGTAPIVSYYFGQQERARIRAYTRRALTIIGLGSALLAGIGWFLAYPIASIYLPSGTPVHDLAQTAIRFALIAVVFSGYNWFTSGFFTALSNWKDSTLLAFCRSFVFLLTTLAVLPRLFDLTGMWLALPAAEILAAGLATWLLLRRASRYGYGRHDDAPISI